MKKVIVSRRAKSSSKRRSATTERNVGKTQLKILKAATSEFARWGYGGARIERISLRAGTNDRSLYYYFGSKKELFRVVLERAYLDVAQAEYALNLGKLEPADAIKHVVKFTWDYYLAHPELLSLLGTENLHRGEHIKRSSLATTFSATQVAILKDILDRGTSSGIFRTGVDPVHMWLTISALSYFYVANRYTLSTYLGLDLMQIRRRTNWLDHMTDTVLTYVTKPVELR
jgi:AcrR family transcriptional regulator